jgi:phage tail-like protein
MAERTYPYSQFNFLVEWNGLDPDDTVKAGFQEVSGIGLEVNVAEYRAGNSKENHPIKIAGTSKTPDITLKRGVVGNRETSALPAAAAMPDFQEPTHAACECSIEAFR